MLIQLHILQNYAPSNLNRDDTGAPKDAMFGGFRRGRISSQCLKRSMRRSESFTSAFQAEGLLGMRTKSLPALIEEALRELTTDETVISAIVSRVPEIGRESKKGKDTDDEEAQEGEKENETEKKSETKQLIFLSKNEMRPLAEKLLSIYNSLGSKDWKKTKFPDIAKQLEPSLPRSVDIAMFGRMTTSAAFEDVEAAVQVAHAISTNALAQEFDYYTAVDDLSGESGAGMIGDVEFNSSTYYKYINVCWDELLKNLGGDVEVARKAVLALVQAAIFAQPSGKQNSFAAFNLPDLLLVEVSQRNVPVSYANAFLKPARSSGDKTLMQASVDQLGEYMQKALQSFSLKAERAFVCLDECKLPGSQQAASLVELETWLDGQMKAQV